MRRCTVGFDLDGVLVNDVSLRVTSETADVSAMLKTRMNSIPLFDLRKLTDVRVLVVTARPYEDKDSTESWINETLPSVGVRHNNRTGVQQTREAAMFKAHKIMSEGIRVFFESDRAQVAVMQEELSKAQYSCKVFVFSDVIVDALSRVIDEEIQNTHKGV